MTCSSSCGSSKYVSHSTCLRKPPFQTILPLIIIFANTCNEIACDNSCLTCNEANSTNCLSCPIGKLLYGGVCVSSCPSNTFSNAGHCQGKQTKQNKTK